jgi:hypothetical protein
LGQSTLVVLCAGSTLLLVQSYTLDKAPHINCLELSPSQLASTFGSWFFLLLVRKPWFHTEGRLAAMLIIPSSWGSQLGAYHTLSSNFSGAVAGEKEDFFKGSLSLPIFLLCYCFAYFFYFIFASIFLSKIQKK